MKDDKYLKYSKILGVRKALLLTIVIGFLSIFILSLVIDAERPIMVLGFIVTLAAIGINFWLQAINLCPWCKKPFLNKIELAECVKDPQIWITRNNCANCKKPDISEEA